MDAFCVRVRPYVPDTRSNVVLNVGSNIVARLCHT